MRRSRQSTVRRSRQSTLDVVRGRLAEWRESYALFLVQASTAPLCRDMATLLSFVMDNKIIGTSGRGNMPLKAVRAVAPLLSKPPNLEMVIGERTFQRRSEQEVWPLYLLHILAEVGRLIQTGRSRRWKLTAQGEQFLLMEPDIQLAYTLAVWWHRVNWLVSYPFEGMGENLPYGFSIAALSQLRAIPTGIDISFTEYANELIEVTGLVWGAPESSIADDMLRGSVERMIIDVLASCEAMECTYKTRTTLGV